MKKLYFDEKISCNVYTMPKTKSQKKKIRRTRRRTRRHGGMNFTNLKCQMCGNLLHCVNMGYYQICRCSNTNCEKHTNPYELHNQGLNNMLNLFTPLMQPIQTSQTNTASQTSQPNTASQTSQPNTEGQTKKRKIG
jgi:hypothetical protein